MSNRNVPRTYLTGWCSSANHTKCPHMIRAHRVTPQGKDLREIWCHCACHHEKRSSAQQIPLGN